MHLQLCPSLSYSSHWEKIGLKNEDTGLAKDLGKLGILSLELFHIDSLSLSCHFFSWAISNQANKCSSEWPAPGQGSTKLYGRCILPPLCPAVASRLAGCQLSWARTSQTQLQGSFWWKTHWWSEIPHGQAHRQFGETHFPSRGRRMLHAITPPAKRGRNVEEKIDSSSNKPWAQLGIPRQPNLFRTFFFFFLVRNNYILVILYWCWL